jgi:hypothetical protein
MNLADSGPDSLRDAIAVTPSGGTVDFQAGLTGTIMLSTGELMIAKDLSIVGPGESVITVSGNHASRVFHIAVKLTASISGLTIANGEAPFAGGIWNEGTLTVTGCTITANLGSAGHGGILNGLGATLTVTDSAITGNVATSAGANGGGISSVDGSLTITDTTISGNSAGDFGFGGGIFYSDLQHVGILIIANSTINDNFAHDGGGIFVEFGSATVASSSISGNFVPGVGGGVANFGLLTVIDSTITGNYSELGGGIHNGGSTAPLTLTITNSTITDNSATLLGGGIYIDPGDVTTLRNTLLGGNTASESPDVFGLLSRSQGHNLIGIGDGGSGFHPTDLVGTAAFPIDPMLEPLGDYGGRTQTMRPLPGSPVINLGDNTDAPDTDQRGFPRIILGFIDIGAVELQPDEFGGPGGSSAAPLLLTRLPAERVAVAPTADASAFPAPATPMRSAPADGHSLGAFFAVLGGTREGGQPEFLSPLTGRQTAQPPFGTLFGVVAADDYSI